jgi:hypothetical protein
MFAQTRLVLPILALIQLLWTLCVEDLLLLGPNGNLPGIRVQFKVLKKMMLSSKKLKIYSLIMRYFVLETYNFNFILFFYVIKQIVDVAITDNDEIQIDVDITNSADTFQVVSGSFLLSWFQILNSHCAFFTHVTNYIVRNFF